MSQASLLDSLQSSSLKVGVTKSPEVITPSAFDHDRRQQSGRVAVFNLVSTMIGGGVLSLPFAVSRCGLALGLILLLLSAVASDFSFDILVSSARRTGAMTYAQIAYFAFGKKTTFMIPLLVFILCWMAGIAYLVIMGDLYTPVICFFGNISDDECGDTWRLIAICGGCALVAPVCYFRNLGALKYTSVISLGSVFTLAGVIMYQTISSSSWSSGHTIYYTDTGGNSVAFNLLHPDVKLWPSSWQDALYVFPIFGVSFLCHFNIPQVHSELTRPSRKRVRRVLNATVFLCCILYSIVGTFGYLWSFEYTCGNILLNYKKQNVLITIGRLGLGLAVMLSFPLLILPARASFHNLLNQCKFLTFKGMNLHDSATFVKIGQNGNNNENDTNDAENSQNSQNYQKTKNLGENTKNSKNLNKRSENDYIYPNLAQSVSSSDTDASESDWKVPQQSLQPMGRTQQKNQYTRSASPQMKGMIGKDGKDGLQQSIGAAAAHVEMENDELPSSSLVAAVHIEPGVRGSINSPRQKSKNIQVLDRRAMAYEQQKNAARMNGKEELKRAEKGTKNFMTRSFSGMNSPLRRTEDAIAVVHHPSDLEKFDDLKVLWDKLDSAVNYEPSNIMLIIETSLLVGSVLFVSTEVQSVLTLWTVMGSTVSFLIGFTFPGAFFWTIRKNRKSRFRNHLSLFVSIVSALLLTVCTWQAILHVSDPACPITPTQDAL